MSYIIWTYSQSTGNLSIGDELTGKGYSGNGEGFNNPAKQDVRQVGPIPQGKYIIGPAVNDPVHGPTVMRLKPYPENAMFKRSGFLMHGDNQKHNKTASCGCIVLPPGVRKTVSLSPCRELLVVA